MKGTKIVLVFLIIIGMIGILLASASPGLAATDPLQLSKYAPQAVTGVVYRDSNVNGERDTGEQGIADVTVTAYDASGAVVETVTTQADGSYTLTNLTDGEEYRIEFTNAPDGLQAGPQGSNSLTSVVFITAPATGIDVGFHSAADYCQEEPDLATTIIIQGGGTKNSLVSFPYTAYTNNWNQSKPKPTGLVTFDQIGSTWGLAHQRSSNSIFLSAYMKRHTPFGPGGTGMIYRYDIDDGSLEQFLDLNSLFPGSTGADPHPAGTNYDRDPNSWDSVGKMSLGDIDISGDELTLWAVNLNDRLLYEIPLNSALQPTAPTSASQVHRWPEDSASGTDLSDLTGLDDCPDPDVDIRPFGLKEHDGMVYVGLVCGAESTQDRNDLRAYVYQFDPDSHNFTQVLNFPLNYPRGTALKYSNGDYRGAKWQYWRSNGNLSPTNGQKNVVWPQPMLSDIEFYHGDMIVGLRDRLGDQTGYKQYLPNGSTEVSGVTAGDVLRASPDGAGGWTIENNAQGSTFGPSLGANSGQGPGGGEFYFRERFKDAYVLHDETSMGALIQVDSLDEIAVTSMDPVDGSAYSYYSGGVKWMSHTDGTITRVSGKAHQYQLTSEFGKSHGLGDLEALCDPPPIEIGNRLWIDLDGDGIQDPGEEPLEGVTVVLKDPDGNVIGTVTTNSDGEYFFSSDPNRTDTGNADYGITGLLPNTSGYTIEVDLDQTPLDGLALTKNDTDSSDNGDARDSDAVEQNGVAVVTFDTGPVGDNNHTYDIGFRPKVAIGNLVWHDANNNSQVDSGEEGIPNIPVKLYRDTNGDGILDPAVDELVDTTTTDSNGYYQFLDVPPSTEGDPTTYYLVAVDQQAVKDAGYDYSSTGGDHDPDAQGDHDAAGGDDGIPDGTYVVSQAFPATVGGQSQASQSDTGDPENYYDDSAYMTVDFGFFNDDDDAPPTAITVQDVSAKANSIIWALAFLMVAMFGLSFFWLRRQYQAR